MIGVSVIVPVVGLDPEIVTWRWWYRVLHDHVAARLRRALRDLPGVVVSSAPFHLTH